MSNFEQLWAITPEAFQRIVAEELRTQPEAAPHPAALPPEASALPSAPSSPQTLLASFLGQDRDASFSERFGTVQGVAVIPVSGTIQRASTWRGTGRQEVQTMLALALEDPAVKGILFDICSPGGEAAGVHELGQCIAAARRQKPCAAYADSLCASAAYWLAAATGRVFAGASATVGSIGVVYRHSNWSAAYKDYGVTFTYVTAGSQKIVGADNSPLSDRDKEILQGRVNAIYELFTADVAQHMGLALDARDRWADGRCFMGQEALDLGLVSALAMSRDDAIEHFTKEIGMDRKEFAAQFPQEFAAIQQEAVQAYQAEHPQTDTSATALAMVGGLCGEAVAGKVKALLDSGMTEAQFKAVLPLLGAQANAQRHTPETESAKAAPAPQAAASNADVLAALQAATPSAVTADGAQQQDDAAAAIQRIASLK